MTSRKQPAASALRADVALARSEFGNPMPTIRVSRIGSGLGEHHVRAAVYLLAAATELTNIGPIGVVVAVPEAGEVRIELVSTREEFVIDALSILHRVVRDTPLSQAMPS